jgi:hypothetical protein
MVRSRSIPKADGKQRPLGIAALEDKIANLTAAETTEAAVA